MLLHLMLPMPTCLCRQMMGGTSFGADGGMCTWDLLGFLIDMMLCAVHACAMWRCCQNLLCTHCVATTPPFACCLLSAVFELIDVHAPTHLLTYMLAHLEGRCPMPCMQLVGLFSFVPKQFYSSLGTGNAAVGTYFGRCCNVTCDELYLL